MAQEDDQKSLPEPRPRRKRRVMMACWGITQLGVSMFATFAVGLLVYLYSGRPLPLPEPIKERFTAGAARHLPNATLQFNRFDFVLRDGWQPRISLSDVRLTAKDGRPVVAFDRVDTALSRQDLFQGRIRPSRIDIDGVSATIRRLTDGSVALRGAADWTAVQQAENLPALVNQIDRLLTSPALSALKSAELQSLTLIYEDLIGDDVWTVDGGRLRLDRRDDDVTLAADLALLTGNAGAATIAANYRSTIGLNSAQLGMTFSDLAASDIASQSPALAWLDILRAPISGAFRTSVDALGNVQNLNATLSIAAGFVQPTDETRPIPFDDARVYFSYDHAARLLRFDEVSVVSAWGAGRATGVAELRGLESGTLTDLVGQFNMSDLRLEPADLYDEPVLLQEADFDFRMGFEPFQLDLGQLSIRDKGQTFVLNGQISAKEAGWAYAIDGALGAMSVARVVDLWPPNVVPRTRQWLIENVEGGTLEHLDLAMRVEPDTKPDIYVSFDYRGADIRYAKALPIITDAVGHASLLHNRFVIALDSGVVTAPLGGEIRAAGSSFIIPDITGTNAPPGVARVQIDGPIPAVLSVLDLPPLSVLSRAGHSPSMADGRAKIGGTLTLPLRKGVTLSDMAYNATGTLLGVESEEMVEGRTFRADTLALDLSETQVAIGGKGTLDGIPFDATWSQPIGEGAAPGGVVGEIALSQAAATTFGLGLPEGTFSGQTAAEFAIDFRSNAPPAFRMISGLEGLGLSVESLAWSKAPQTRGSLELEGRLGPVPDIDLLRLTAPGLSLDGEIAFAPDGTLQRARFQDVSASGWLDAPVDLVGRGKGVAPEIVVRGGTIDLRERDLGGSNADGAPMPVRVSLDRLQITDTIALEDVEGRLSIGGGLSGELRGRLNGGPEITGRLVPQNGGTAIRVISENAGGVFRAAGLLRQARGGVMDLILTPRDGSGTFDGRLRVRNARIKDAPVMADLLSAISVVGLLEQLSGDGIQLNDVQASFVMTPEVIRLQEASATGPSIGISMDGTYGFAEKTLDMKGVISPVYFLNGIGSFLSRRGEGLIGFNYNVRGPAENARVTVNPLSALTPGMFREIFRARPPDENAGRIRRRRQEQLEDR